jgi:hypothetical protein
MENMLFINIIMSIGLAILSTYSRYQFREDSYDTKDEWLEARRTCMRRRMFVFPLLVVIMYGW